MAAGVTVHWHVHVSRELVLFLAVPWQSGESNNLIRVCLTVAVPSHLGGKECPQFDSLLSSTVCKRMRLKLVPKPVDVFSMSA